jgi:TetR/AcrR family transcriptional regulator
MAKDRDRRADLLVAAAEEFATKGFAGARIEAIARRAGVNKQLVFYYFRSKRGLFEAVLARQPAADVPRPRDAAAPATDQLRRALVQVVDWLERHPEARCTLFDQATEASVAATLVAQLEQGIRNVVSEGQGLGYFRDGADPGQVAHQGLVLCAGWWAMNGKAGRRSDWTDHAAETLLRALTW